MITRRGLMFASLGAMPALAIEAWHKKPSEWSDKDIQRLLTKSPWVTDATVEFNPQGMAGGPPDGGMGGGSPGSGMGGPPGGGMGPGGPSGGIPQLRAVVRWESALPIRTALKMEAAPLPKRYVISVSGFPKMPGRERRGPNPGNMQTRVKEATLLARKGKDPIYESSVEFREGAETTAIVFTFDGTSQPIQTDDKEVMFVTSFGPMQIRAKFIPREMKYQGKLEL